MTITDYTQSHKFTRSVFAFDLLINGKEVQGTYEQEDSDWSIDSNILIENDEDLTEEEYEAVSDYVYDKFGNL